MTPRVLPISAESITVPDPNKLATARLPRSGRVLRKFAP